MNSRLLLIIALICSFSFGKVYTIYPDNVLREDFFYTIPHIVEQIPELQVDVFDATDQDISRHGRSSIHHNATSLMVDGIRVSTLQDGILTGDLRTVGNSAIDSILIYTGVHANQWAGSYPVVIDIITKDIRKNSIGGTAYMGSELGDPTVLLKVMDSTLIPYNKEQFAAGEVYGTLMTGKVAHYAGLNLIYMDRYSNRLEEERSNYYPDKNSSYHMEEIRKGNYGVQFNNRHNNVVDIALTDYNLFRYNQYEKRYYYYEGTRGKLSFHDAVQGDAFFASLNTSIMVEQADFYTSDTDYLEDTWGEFFISTEVGYRGKNNYSLSVEGINPVGTRPIEISDSTSYLKSVSDFQINGKISWLDEKLITTLSYPPAASIISEFRSKSDATISLAGAVSYLEDKSGAAPDLSAEFEYLKPFTKSRILGRAGVDYTPGLTRGESEIRFGENEVIPWGELGYSITTLLDISLYGSPYLFKSDIHSQYTFNGLTIAGGLSLKSKTLWDGDTNTMLPFTKKDGGTTTLSSRITGEVSISYALFEEHLKLAVAARDLGKVRYDFPHGANVGPVIVSNFQIQF